jgi:membrane-associated protease RseP (regulator of RpoE activity)
MSFILGAVVVCMLLHVMVIALAGAALGVTIREVTIGLGPTAFTVGRLRVKALPYGGAVRFKDSREEELDAADTRDALDGRPTWVQLFVGLSGCLALIALAIAALQAEGVRAFVAGFPQIVAGALSPLGAAQSLLAQAVERVAALPFVAILGLVAAKLAAFNLLPLPGANGGFVIGTVARAAGIARAWPQALTTALFFVYMALGISWVVALVVFLVR